MQSKLEKNNKKAKSTQVETQLKLDDIMKSGNEKFEQNKLEMIGKMSSKMAHDFRNSCSITSSCRINVTKTKKQQDVNLTYSRSKMEDVVTTIINQINDVTSFIRKPMFQFSCCDLKNVLTVITSGMYIITTVKLDLFLDSNIVKCDIIKIKGVITNIIQNSVQAIKARLHRRYMKSFLYLMIW